MFSELVGITVCLHGCVTIAVYQFQTTESGVGRIRTLGYAFHASSDFKSDAINQTLPPPRSPEVVLFLECFRHTLRGTCLSQKPLNRFTSLTNHSVSNCSERVCCTGFLRTLVVNKPSVPALSRRLVNDSHHIHCHFFRRHDGCGTSSVSFFVSTICQRT